MSTKDYAFIDVLQKIEEEELTHYVDVLTNDEKIKSKKEDLLQYIIIDDIDIIYLVDNIITQDY